MGLPIEVKSRMPTVLVFQLCSDELRQQLLRVRDG